MNNVYLKDIKNSLILDNYNANVVTRNFSNKDIVGYDAHIYKIPFCRTVSGNNCLSIFLPKFINYIIKNTYELSFYNYKKNILNSIELYYNHFETLFMNH